MPSRFLNFKYLGIVLWLALILQGLAAIVLSHPWMTADSSVYLRLAASLSEGSYGSLGPLGYHPDPLRPPGYPIILCLTHFVGGLPISAVVALQVAVCLGTILLIDRFLKSRGSNPLPFRALAVIYPFPVLYSSFVMTEVWAMLLLTAVALLLARQPLGRKALAVAGGLGGAAALIRTDLLLLPVVVSGIAFYYRVRSRQGIAASIVDSAIPLVLSALILLPYALWNHSNFGKFVPAPVAAAAGSSLYTATWQAELSPGDFDAFYQGRSTERAVSSGLIAEVTNLNRSIGAPPMTPPFNPAEYSTVELQVRSNLVFGKAAIDRIVRDPVQYGRHVIGNLWWLWNTSRYPAGIPIWVQACLIAVSGLIYVLGMAGALLATRGRLLADTAPCALIMLYVFAVHLPLHTEARYTAAARPLLLMFASLALLKLISWIGSRRSKSAG